MAVNGKFYLEISGSWQLCPEHPSICAYIAAPQKFLISDAGRTLLDLVSPTRRSTYVDLALRLDVLAVCAVFAFVGAILLGAF